MAVQVREARRNLVRLLLRDYRPGAGRGGNELLALARRYGVGITVLLAVICLALALMAILSRARRRPGSVLVESVLIVCTYVVGVWLLSRRR